MDTKQEKFKNFNLKTLAVLVFLRFTDRAIHKNFLSLHWKKDCKTIVFNKL